MQHVSGVLWQVTQFPKLFEFQLGMTRSDTGVSRKIRYFVWICQDSRFTAQLRHEKRHETALSQNTIIQNLFGITDPPSSPLEQKGGQLHLAGDPARSTQWKAYQEKTSFELKATNDKQLSGIIQEKTTSLLRTWLRFKSLSLPFQNIQCIAMQSIEIYS